jgi:hypothetical protein
MNIQDLFAVQRDVDLEKLGFVYQGKFVESGEEYANFFERLLMWHNEDIGIDVLFADFGNSYCGLVAIKPAEVPWIAHDDTQLRGRLKNGLHYLIQDNNKKEWDFNIWKPDEEDEKEIGLFYAGGVLNKSEYPELADAYVWLRNNYNKSTRSDVPPPIFKEFLEDLTMEQQEQM